jgi:hypothetical protein
MSDYFLALALMAAFAIPAVALPVLFAFRHELAAAWRNRKATP